MRRPLLVFAALLLLAQPTWGQEASPRVSPPLIKYGKWVTLAASVAMNVMAARAANQADEAFDVIRTTCRNNEDACATLPNGRYVDPVLERQYQRSLDKDRAARAWLIGGETVLVGTAVMFIWELTRSKSRPENIPFEPEVSTRAGRTQVGVRFAF